MKQEILSRFPWPWLSAIALIIFFVFFVGLLIRLWTNSRQPEFLRAQRLPFEDGEKLSPSNPLLHGREK